MRFRDWLNVNEVGWLQQHVPSKMDYFKSLASSGLKAAAGALPLVGAIAPIGEAIWDIMQLRMAGRDVRQAITQMMDSKDKAPGVPANILDLDDNLSYSLSKEAKLSIAQQVMDQMDKVWIPEVRAGKMTSGDANKVAIAYLQQQIQKAQVAKPAQQPVQQPPQGQQPQQANPYLTPQAQQQAAPQTVNQQGV